MPLSAPANIWSFRRHTFRQTPQEAEKSVKRLIEMNLDLERILVGHGDDIYEGAKNNLGRIFAGPRAN